MPWTKIQKPSEASITGLSGGEPIGMLMAITESVSTGSSVVSGWGNITKPTSSVWTQVQKPSSSVWSLIAKPTD